MKIRKMTITNLFSFRQAELSLSDYNVIVGHNASGKTNILRIIELLTGINEEAPMRYGFDEIRLPQNMRFDRNSRSTIIADIDLSELEARLLLELIFRADLSEVRTMRSIRISVVVSWPPTVEPWTRPDFVLFRFENGLAILREDHTHVILMHLDFAPNNMGAIERRIAALRKVARGDSIISIYEQVFGFPHDSILQNASFRDQMIEQNDNLSRYFSLEEDKTTTAISIQTELRALEYRLHIGAPQFEARIANYCNPAMPDGISVSIWLLMRIFMNRDLSILRDMPVEYETLANQLFRIEKTEELAPLHDALVKGFANLFDGATFKISQPDPAVQKYKVHIIEKDGRRTDLEHSASGYYEALKIFSTSIFENDRVVLLDEPASHLHPTKIKLLSRNLMQIARTQVVVVTHSPFFVDTDLFTAGKSLHYVKKGEASEIYSKSDSKMTMKSHLFEPNIFFCRFNIFVEGPSDASALIAMSDYYNGIFETKDILVTYVQGKGDVDNYYQLATEYEIPCLFMVDGDYGGKAKPIIKLEKELECELRELGWKGKAKSADPVDVYDFIFDKMQTDKDKIKKTKLAKAFNSALNSVGIDMKKIWTQEEQKGARASSTLHKSQDKR